MIWIFHAYGMHEKGLEISLPLEMQGKITKTIFYFFAQQDTHFFSSIDVKKLNSYPLFLPLDYGAKYIQEFKELKDQCNSPIGGKLFSVYDMYAIPYRDRELIFSAGYSHFLHDWVNEGAIENITDAELERLNNLPLFIKKDFTLKIFPQNRYARALFKLRSAAAFSVGAETIVAFLLYLGYKTHLVGYDHWSLPLTGLCYALSCLVIGFTHYAFVFNDDLQGWQIQNIRFDGANFKRSFKRISRPSDAGELATNLAWAGIVHR